MLTYSENMFGDHLYNVANNMIELAKAACTSVVAEFNEVNIYADANSNVSDVVGRFLSEIERRHEAYLSSERGFAAAAEARSREQELQNRADDLMAALEFLDFSDDVAVLNWLCELQPCSDHIGVDVSPHIVVDEFKRNGYYAGVNCGVEFDGSDRDNFHRYIVGQCLDMLASVGAIHSVIRKFADDWRKRF